MVICPAGVICCHSLTLSFIVISLTTCYLLSFADAVILIA